MQKSETKKFDQKAYIKEYEKEKYKKILIRLKPSEYEQIEDYCQNMDISKNRLLIDAALYIIDNDLLSEIKK